MEGIDVHGDKGLIAWDAVKAAGISFAFVKASEGLTFEDQMLKTNLAGATRHGILVGPYHYARPDIRPSLDGARDEAEVFVKRIKAAGWDKAKHARPVLDLEEGGGDLSGWALVFCETVEALTGVAPILYTYTSFVRSFIAHRANAAKLVRFQLWLANYSVNDGKRHAVSVESPWTQLTIHQYTSRGKTPGVGGNCDRNFAESLAPLTIIPVVQPFPGKGQPMWMWIRWWRGVGEFKKFGPRFKPFRNRFPKRIPASWWARLALNLGHKGKPYGSGGPSKVQ